MNNQIANMLKKTTKGLILLFINFMVLIISLFIPKSEKIIVVGSWFGKRFADNSKYSFVYVNQNKERLGIDKIIWITRSNLIKEELNKQGFNVYKAWSIQSIWYHFRAKIHLIDQSVIDINPFFSVRSKRINLWHGFPLKKIGNFIGNGDKKKSSKGNLYLNSLLKMFFRGCWGDYYVLATSDFSANILGEAFAIPNEKMIISGYPRNYEAVVNKPVLHVSENEKVYLDLVTKAKKEGNKVIGYFPTFRDKRETLIFGTKEPEELQILLDFFQNSNIKVIGKFHFAGKNDTFSEIHDHEALINLPSNNDLYTFLREIDILITDYSSIYFDFLLWNKPIIFFPYDLDYYRDEDRGLIFDYEEFTPGPKAYNIEELKNLLSIGIDELNSSYQKQYGQQASNIKAKIFGKVKEMQIDHLIKQIRNL